MILVHILALAVSFVILFKCADLFVDGSCTIAGIFQVPKMVVGIVLVGLATTAPEFGVSVTAAFLGKLEISLGNAIGSVICDDGVALGLAAVVAPVPILVNCRLIKVVGIFLLAVDFLAYGLARNGVIGRSEGILFIVILFSYYTFLIKNRSLRNGLVDRDAVPSCDLDARPSVSRKMLLKRPVALFAAGLAGVILSSRIIVWAAVNIAQRFSVSETIIGLTVVAIGTSLPEISTCITAGLKGEGELAVGNIIGADILNILWIIGVSSVVRPIQVNLDVINFTFPYMIFIVAVMLLSMRIGCRLGKAKGILLFSLYILYLILMVRFLT